jgi:selenocysteine lyase/cysteine desulfurase
MGLVRAEWPKLPDRSIYLNTGSCGRKPASVLKVLAQSWETFNTNPTYYTFFADEWLREVRTALAELLAVSHNDLLLTQNSTQGLHLVLNSFLLTAGDELVTTTHEHGSVNTIARYLAETRGVVIRRHECNPMDGSEAFCQSVIAMVSEATRLIQVSEVDCYSGWRPNLRTLVQWCQARKIPLLVDGAHSLGQGICSPGEYPMWITSGHKWLGGPNGTGILYVQRAWQQHLRPVWLGDRFYNEFADPLMRFEFQGTADVVRWKGLTAAIALYRQLDPGRVAARQTVLTDYLRKRLDELPSAVIRTPDTVGETSGALAVTWEAGNVPVPHLKDHLWNVYKIWTQPDFCYGDPGLGLRISCHISIEERDIDRLIEALHQIVR